MTCQATYSTEYLPVQSSCRTTCRGCTFSAIVSTNCSGTTCHFSWTVHRTGCASEPDATFTGSADLNAGQSKVVDFYCDPAEACARFRITLTCSADQ